MTNFIFKSQGTFKKINNQLEMILSELRCQRTDHAKMIYILDKLMHDRNLQKQVDKYYDESETSPQTNLDNIADN